ncbi:MAG: DUF6506 family protein, partial [Oscillospiraceae bacterium]|nr:DUF6506 family protein [Oscillospiraceae bacterium]
RLVKQGVDCIELCGAFGEDGAREIIAVTENKEWDMLRICLCRIGFTKKCFQNKQQRVACLYH